VSDDLRRSFRDKLRRRPAGRPNGQADPVPPAEEGPETIAVHAVTAGPYPQAAGLHPRFVRGLPRIRLTLDIGAGLRRRPELLPAPALEGLLRICPLLPEHECGSGGPLEPGAAGGDADGLGLAHLIEHVAIELVASATGGRCHGVTCAWRDRLDRFDIFLECPDVALGRASALLAAALVRDLCAGAGRVEDHRRSRDLLAAFTRLERREMVPEDAASLLGVPLEQAVSGLEDLRRLGYLELAAAPFTFSTATGLLFRRAGQPGP
jgi:hypothetical protein